MRGQGLDRPGTGGPPSLTVLMPALNEEAGIGDAVAACVACGERLERTGKVSAVEVLVVDDGSTDGTAGELRRLGDLHRSLRVVHHEANVGLGGALRSGFEATRTDLVFYTDADLPVDLQSVDRALDLLVGDIDAVAAYRSRRGGEGPRRFVYSLAYNSLCRVALGLRLRDVNFAAKLLRTEQVQQLGLCSNGSFIDAELLARLDHAGGRIAQFPAAYHPRSRGVSTLSSASVIVEIVREMYHLRPSIQRTRSIAVTP